MSAVWMTSRTTGEGGATSYGRNPVRAPERPAGGLTRPGVEPCDSDAVRSSATATAPGRAGIGRAGARRAAWRVAGVVFVVVAIPLALAVGAFAELGLFDWVWTVTR